MVVHYAYIEGLRHKEIAETMACAVNVNGVQRFSYR